MLAWKRTTIVYEGVRKYQVGVSKHKTALSSGKAPDKVTESTKAQSKVSSYWTGAYNDNSKEVSREDDNEQTEPYMFCDPENMNRDTAFRVTQRRILGNNQRETPKHMILFQMRFVKNDQN